MNLRLIKTLCYSLTMLYLLVFSICLCLQSNTKVIYTTGQLENSVNITKTQINEINKTNRSIYLLQWRQKFMSRFLDSSNVYQNEGLRDLSNFGPLGTNELRLQKKTFLIKFNLDQAIDQQNLSDLQYRKKIQDFFLYTNQRALELVNNYVEHQNRTKESMNHFFDIEQFENAISTIKATKNHLIFMQEMVLSCFSFIIEELNSEISTLSEIAFTLLDSLPMSIFDMAFAEDFFLNQNHDEIFQVHLYNFFNRKKDEYQNIWFKILNFEEKRWMENSKICSKLFLSSMLRILIESSKKTVKQYP